MVLHCLFSFVIFLWIVFLLQKWYDLEEIESADISWVWIRWALAEYELGEHQLDEIELVKIRWVWISGIYWILLGKCNMGHIGYFYPNMPWLNFSIMSYVNQRGIILNYIVKIPHFFVLAGQNVYIWRYMPLWLE